MSTDTAIAGRPVCIRPDDTEALWGLGERSQMRINPAHTGGAFQLIEVLCLPGGGPPPHVHRHEDEAFYLLDGQMEFLLGDRIVEASAGQFVWAPRGQVHQFRVPGPNPARFLVWIGPGNLDAMFRKFGVPSAPGDLTPPPMDPDLPARVLETARSFGIEFDFQATGRTRESIPAAPGLWVLGVHVRFLGTGQQTDGRLCVVDLTVPVNAGPPPHQHRDQSETFHITAGDFEIVLGERVLTAAAGSTIHVPPRITHAFRCVGNGPGRMLSIHSPAGMEMFFRECGVEGPIDQAPEVGLPDPQRLLDIFRRHGMDVV